MSKAKTLQQGYYKLKPANKWLHFSMNCWVNLKEDSGQSLMDFGKAYEEGDIVDQFIALTNVAFAALKANDQEEGNDIDYDIYKVRAWMEQLKEEDSADFVKAMTHATGVGKTKGKK